MSYHEISQLSRNPTTHIMNIDTEKVRMLSKNGYEYEIQL